MGCAICDRLPDPHFSSTHANYSAVRTLEYKRELHGAYRNPKNLWEPNEMREYLESLLGEGGVLQGWTYVDVRRRTSTYVVIRRRTSSYVDVRRRTWTYVDVRGRTSTYIDVRGRTSTYVNVRRRTWTYFDVRRRTSMYVDVRPSWREYYNQRVLTVALRYEKFQGLDRVLHIIAHKA